MKNTTQMKPFSSEVWEMLKQDWSASRSTLCLQLAGRFFRYWLWTQILGWSCAGIFLMQFLLFDPAGFSHEFGDASVALHLSSMLVEFLKSFACEYGVCIGVLLMLWMTLIKTEKRLRTNGGVAFGAAAVRNGIHFSQNLGAGDEK